MIEIRCLIANPEAGIIIGKGGVNVTNMRKQSGAYITVLRNENNSKERVLQVKGLTTNITAAFGLIMALLIEESIKRAAKTDPSRPIPTSHPVKFLVHKFLAGCIIGKGGSIITQIMTDTNTKISLSAEPLPGSTDKTCTITGEPDAACMAIQRICDQLRDNPLKSGSSSVLYVPGAPANPYGAMPSPYGAAPLANPYGAAPLPIAQPMYGAPQPAYGAPVQPYAAAPAYGVPAQPAYGAPAMGGFGAPAQPAYGAPALGGFGAPAASGAQKTEKFVIPTACAGFVIGKSGSVIRDIKMQSSTFISIADPEPTTPDDRVVSVTGSAEGIQSAVLLIQQRVESYRPPGVTAMGAAAALGYQ